MASITHMFSLAVTLDGDVEPRWTAVCDRCGYEVDVEDTSQVVFRVRGFDEMMAIDHQTAAEYTRRLQSSYRARMPIVIDAETDVQEVGRGFDSLLLAHARACSGGRTDH